MSVEAWARAVEDAANHMPMIGPAPALANRNAAAQVIRALLDAGWELHPPAALGEIEPQQEGS